MEEIEGVVVLNIVAGIYTLRGQRPRRICRIIVVGCDRHHDIICKMVGIQKCCVVFWIRVTFLGPFTGKIWQICPQNEFEMALGSPWGVRGGSLGPQIGIPFG